MLKEAITQNSPPVTGLTETHPQATLNFPLRLAKLLPVLTYLTDIVTESISNTGHIIGSQRSFTNPSEVRGSAYWSGYLRRGRGRGPCNACINGQEQGHHGGSKCRKRGTLGFNMESQQPPVIMSRLPSKLSGLYQF